MAKFLRNLLVLITKLFFGLVVLIVLVIAIGVYANHRAIKAAEHFCDQIAVGSNLSQSVEAAKAAGVRHIEPLHQFYFQGWVFNAALCIVEVEDNKVLSKRIEMRGN